MSCLTRPVCQKVHAPQSHESISSDGNCNCSPASRSARRCHSNETRSSLIRRIKETGHARDWSEFVNKYRPMLVNLARRQGLSIEDAEDVAQDILIVLLRKLPTFPFDRNIGRFRTWLWHIAMNAVIDRQRKAQRKNYLERQILKEAVPAAACSEPAASDTDETSRRLEILTLTLQHVRQTASQLSWICFEQHLLRRRPSAAVAAELAISTNAVYVHSSRVLKRVREECSLIRRGAADE